jgi:hypothetical protein
MSQKPIIETEGWKLGCFIDWQPKSKVVTCPNCLGARTIGGGLGWLGDPEDCPKCFVTGSITQRTTEPKPDLPVELVEHMRRAWWDFVNKT